MDVRRAQTQAAARQAGVLEDVIRRADAAMYSEMALRADRDDAV